MLRRAAARQGDAIARAFEAAAAAHSGKLMRYGSRSCGLLVMSPPALRGAQRLVCGPSIEQRRHDRATTRRSGGGQCAADLAYAGNGGALDGEPWSVLVRPAQIPFELLVVEHRGRLWDRMVYLRDQLRTSPQHALAYGQLKARWAARYGVGTPGYQQAKREFWAAIADPGTNG
jgi:hypothetical protein